jgi:hypothetical protein
MMTAFVLACVASVTLGHLFTPLQEAWDAFPVTKDQARKKYNKSGYKAFKTSPEHQQAVAEAHVSVRAQRERLGLAPIGMAGVVAAGRGDNIRKSYEDMTGFTAGILGMAMGLQYNSAAGPNKCFNAIEGALTASSNFFWVLARIYMPWYVPEAQLVVQDNIALLGGFYTDCDVNKFFDSMTTLFSEEGLSSLGARGATASQFEYKRYQKAKEDPRGSTFTRGESFGKLFGAITNYHI